MAPSLILIQLLSGLAHAMVLFLIASGLSLIFGVTRIVNFAHGSFYMLAAYLTYTLAATLPLGAAAFYVAALLSAASVGLIGGGVEVLLLRRVYRAPELYQLLLTFALVLVVADLVKLVWGSENLTGPAAPGLAGSVEIAGQLFPTYDLALIALGPLVAGGLWWLFYRTRWGVVIRAATLDREMVAVRGMGSVPGALLAAILIGVIDAFGVLVLPRASLALTFVVMAVVLIVRPWGLLGRPSAETRSAAGAIVTGGAVRVPPRWVAAVLAGLIAVPPLLPTFYVWVLVEILAFALFAASLHLLMGAGGMVSFGHAAAFGLGAYGAALLVRWAKAPMLVAFAAAPLAAAVAAALYGYFCVRLSSIYFAMLTLAFAQIAFAIVHQWYDVTGGDNGLLGIWPAPWLASPVRYYYLALVASGVGLAVLAAVGRAPFGLTLRAARDHARRAEALGIDVRAHQWLAFVVAGVFGGLAGGIFVFLKGSVFPESLAVPVSVEPLVMVLLGGVQALAGAPLGAALYKLLDTLGARYTGDW